MPTRAQAEAKYVALARATNRIKECLDRCVRGIFSGVHDDTAKRDVIRQAKEQLAKVHHRRAELRFALGLPEPSKPIRLKRLTKPAPKPMRFTPSPEYRARIKALQDADQWRFLTTGQR
jgi:hypothetical protein